MNEVEINVAKQISGAAFWSYAANLSDRALRFVVFVIIARLVSRSDFGVVMISLLVIEAMQIFLEAGLSTALLRQATVTEVQFDTAFFMTVSVGFLLSAIVFFAAPYFAVLVGEPRAGAVLRGLSPGPLLNALGSLHSTRIMRNLGFKTMAKRTVAASIAGSAIAIGLAYAGFGLWALVVRTLIIALTKTICVWLAAGWVPKLRYQPSSVRTLVPTGLRLLSSNFIRQINGRGFDFIAGVFLGVAALGTLRIAGQTILLLIDLTVGPLTYVGYTVLSRHKDNPVIFQKGFVFMAQMSAALIFPAFFGLVAIADELFPMLFGARWSGASIIVPFMCAACAPIYLQLMVGSALFAAGRADRMLHWAIIEAFLTLALAFVGAHFGLVGLVAMGSLRLYGLAPLGLYWLKKDAGIAPSLVLKPAAPCLAGAVIMALIVYGVKHLLAGYLAPPVLMFTCALLGVVVYAAMLPIIAQPLVKELKLWRRGRSGFAFAR